MGIDTSGLMFPKGRPRVAVKLEKKRDLAKEERECRKAVDRRDKRRCFFPGCKKSAGEKHHIVSSSVRGRRIWQTDDILSSCTEHHRWFKAGLIAVEGNPDIRPGKRGALKVLPTELGTREGITIPVDNRQGFR